MVTRRPQSPHEAMALMDQNGDAYYLRLKGELFDVISHGPEWLLIVRSDKQDAPFMWRRWDSIEGHFTIEGEYSPPEHGKF